MIDLRGAGFARNISRWYTFYANSLLGKLALRNFKTTMLTSFGSGKEGTVLVNKRHFQRIPATVLAMCERDDDRAPDAYGYFHSCTKDISVSGARFVVDQGVSEGEHFKAALEFPGSSVPLLIECEVVWVKPSERLKTELKEALEVGVKFIKMDSPNDREKLQSYLMNIQ